MRAQYLVLLVAACGGDSGSGVDAPGGGSGSGSATALQVCVQETNRYRTTVPPPGTGAPRAPVTESSALEAYAATGAMYDFTNGPHSHFSSTSGGGIAFAENECPQQGNWQIQPGQQMSDVVKMCVAAFYSEGPGGGHYENMMGAYGSLGCGIYQMGTGVTILQDFGN